MPTPTLDATPGGPNANSYCTLVEAQAYFDSNLYATTWNLPANAANSNANQIVSLIMATRLLDVMYDWNGFPTNPNPPNAQALQWPRIGLWARNRLTIIDYTSIPQDLKNATAELAQALLVSNRTLDNQIETMGVTMLRAGSIELAFKQGVYSKIIPDAVFHLVVPWWGELRARASTNREVMR